MNNIIKASDFKTHIAETRTVKEYKLKKDNSFCSLASKCYEFALYLNRFRKNSKGAIKETQSAIKLAKRLEREFLRSEEAISIATINVEVINGLSTFEHVDIKANYINLRHLAGDFHLFDQKEICNKDGNYKLKAILGKSQHGVDVWSFELIDFKPLGVSDER